MRRVALTACLLAACGGELPERANAGIDAFPQLEGERFYCAFAADGVDGYVFATAFDDPGNRARIVFGGEPMLLVPADAPPAFDGTEQDVLYAVENYPFYDVRLLMVPGEAGLEPTTYSGTVELRDITMPSAPEVVASRDFTGGCGV